MTSTQTSVRPMPVRWNRYANTLFRYRPSADSIAVASSNLPLETVVRSAGSPGAVLCENTIRGVHLYNGAVTPRIQETPRHPQTLISA